MTDRPLVLTLGDPAGIGPEIAIKSWGSLRGAVPFVLLADRDMIASLAARLDVPVREVESPGDAGGDSALPFLHHGLTTRPVPGIADTANAKSVIGMIERAVHMVRAGSCAALVTNPISKLVLKQGAGFAFPGHTEFLAHLDGATAAPVMMLAAPELRVVPVTVHLPLAEVPAALTESLLEATLRTVHAALIGQFGLKEPRIAVSGLNPHAGEGGVMGREEIDIITPVLERLRGEGMMLAGPLAADTMFHPAARARCDAAVCMYHDQALIPLKTLNFSQGVNVTLGLSFVRTSPDHGTAFDIAGQGIADPDSLIAALRLAWTLSRKRT